MRLKFEELQNTLKCALDNLTTPHADIRLCCAPLDELYSETGAALWVRMDGSLLLALDGEGDPCLGTDEAACELIQFAFNYGLASEEEYDKACAWWDNTFLKELEEDAKVLDAKIQDQLKKGQKSCHKCGATPKEQAKGMVCMVCEDANHDRHIDVEKEPCERCLKPFMDPIHGTVEDCPDCKMNPGEEKAHHHFRPKGR